MGALVGGIVAGMSRTRLLTDEMWARIEPLLPDRAPRRGGRWGDHRAVVEAVCWRFRTGAERSQIAHPHVGHEDRESRAGVGEQNVLAAVDPHNPGHPRDGSLAPPGPGIAISWIARRRTRQSTG